MPSQNFSTSSPTGLMFETTYTALPELFFTRQNPGLVRSPQIVLFNEALARELGLNEATSSGPEGTAIWGGNALPDGAHPIAQAYAGHQFGHFTTLGDGRAVLLGEHITPTGQRFDIQLKGGGQTPYSRRGDGRAALGPMLREYIISEAMHGLGIPTTRSLAVVTTGEPVFRETTLPGAILTRVAASHIRVGTFEYARTFGTLADLKALADYTIQRHYPDVLSDENPYRAFLSAVMERQALLIAQWQCVGFVHGVMNTDNMTLSGETIDYGPCAFMDTYGPATVFSSIDRQGRYAYGNQPPIAQWNLARLTETLLPLLDTDPATALELGKAAVASFPERFQRHWLTGMRAKLGLLTLEDDDLSLIEALLRLMNQANADFTNTFRSLTADEFLTSSLSQQSGFPDWLTQWRERLKRQPESFDSVRQTMHANNPAIIPRNHQVEAVILAATTGNDYTLVHHLLKLLKNPYATLEANDVDYSFPAPDIGIAYQTFCGT